MSSLISSRLKKIGIELGVDPYGTPSTTFSHGLYVSNFSVNPKTDVKGVPEVRGDFFTRRVTTKAALDYDANISFPLDMGDNASGNIGHFLAAIFGIDTIGGAGPLYTHDFTLAQVSDPVWYNLFTDKDAVNKQYLGFRAQTIKFTLKAGEGLINVDVTGAIQGESALTNPGTLVFSGSPIVSPQEVALLFGVTTPCFEELSITITRDVQRFRCIGNSRLISNAYTKSFQIQFDAKGLVFANETIRDAFLNGTTDSLTLTITDSSGAKKLIFTFPQTYYQTFTGPDVKDTDLLYIGLSGLATGTGHTAQLVNARATAYTA